MISDIKFPDTALAQQAEQLARSVSNDTLFNHVMRCYWFAELFAQQEGTNVDSELMFLSAVLHDLGLTTLAPGPHRFEIEGAGAARKFLIDKGVASDRAQKVWDNISNFARVYLRETGESPARAVEKLRMEAAVRLLESDEGSIQVVAQRTGFGDDERMRRAFVKTYGVSPQDYRSRFGRVLSRGE